MGTQLDVEVAACWGVPGFGKAPGASSSPPFVSRADAAAPEPVAAAGERIHCFALALLAAQGEGRALWGLGWEEKNGIGDS